MAGGGTNGVRRGWIGTEEVMIRLFVMLGVLLAAPMAIADKAAEPFTQGVVACEEMKTADGEQRQADIYRRGCCSWHKGVCGCRKGRTVCCDGSYSPSCGC